MSLWESLPERQGMAVLDASAGEGRSTQALLALDMRVTATNFDAEPHPELPPEASFVGGVDLNRPFPFDDSSFDGVNLKDVLEHLENPAQTVREIARVLRPGGVAVISTPNVLNASSRIRFALTGFGEGRKRPVSYAKPTGDAGNIYIPNLPLLHYLLAQSGMQIEALAMDSPEWKTVALAIAFTPMFWLGTRLATSRARRKDVLVRSERLKASGQHLVDLQRQQHGVQRRLRRLMLSREVLLSRNLIFRARKTGASPMEA